MPKNVPGCGGSCRDGIGCVMQQGGWDGSLRGEVGHAWVGWAGYQVSQGGVGHAVERWSGSRLGVLGHGGWAGVVHAEVGMGLVGQAVVGWGHAGVGGSRCQGGVGVQH